MARIVAVSDAHGCWNKVTIPECNILISAGDYSHRGEELYKAVCRTNPKYHIFGHIHYSYGVQSDPITTYMNAAICNEGYKPANAPHVFEV